MPLVYHLVIRLRFAGCTKHRVSTYELAQQSIRVYFFSSLAAKKATRR